VTGPRAAKLWTLARLSLCVGLVACGGGGGGGTGGTTGAAGVTGVAGAGAAGTGAAGTGVAGMGAAGATNAGGHGGVATSGTGGGGGATAIDAATSLDASDAGASDVAAVEAHPDAPAGGGCTAAGALCWDFEEGHLPTGWTPYRNEFNGTLLVDGTKPHQGKFALHAMDLMGNVEGKDGGPKKTMRFNLPTTFGPTLWGRAFVFTKGMRPMSHAGLFNARYPRPGAAMNTWTNITTLDWYEVATSAMNYVSIFHPPEPPGTPEWVQTSDTPLVLDAWACVEWLFDSANGGATEGAEPRVWVDGAEIAWSKTFVVPATAARPAHEKATTFTVLEAGIYLYQGLSMATNWWIDDLGVSPQRIGCN
jgi:hypothetical protein